MRVVVLIWFGCALAIAVSDGLAAAVGPRPNFVVIVADDMACDDCGAYGHPHIRTPNLNRMAKEGMRFERAILTCSSCSPSRTSTLTGRYPHATGAAELHTPVPPEQVFFTQPLRESGYYTASAGKWHLGPAAKLKFDLVKEGGGPGGYADWLSLLRDRPKDRPFFFWLASTDPHRPYVRHTTTKPHQASDVIVPPFLPDVPEVRNDLAMYYDAISRLDGQVGEVLAELDRQGIARNTLVVFLSDNGRPFPRCKTTVFDSGVRTPLIMRWPGEIAAGSVCPSLVSSVDLAPTLLELAECKPIPSLHGTSMVILFTNPKAEIRLYAFAEHNWHDYMAFERGVRSRRYAYIANGLPQMPRTPPADAVRSPSFLAMRKLREEGKLSASQMQCFTAPLPAEELYDCQTDPHCLSNLAADPKFADVKEQLRSVLAVWQQETGDARPDPLTPDKFDRETGRGLGSRTPKAAK